MSCHLAEYSLHAVSVCWYVVVLISVVCDVCFFFDDVSVVM